MAHSSSPHLPRPLPSSRQRRARLSVSATHPRTERAASHRPATPVHTPPSLSKTAICAPRPLAPAPTTPTPTPSRRSLPSTRRYPQQARYPVSRRLPPRAPSSDRAFTIRCPARKVTIPPTLPKKATWSPNALVPTPPVSPRPRKWPPRPRKQPLRARRLATRVAVARRCTCRAGAPRRRPWQGAAT